MILAAVDDLMFRSKISATARQVGAELAFARSAEETLTQARTLKPRLIILDLNSQGVDPLRTIAQLRNDPELASMRTLGFVSHVQSELIAAAREAGIDEVLARSAFAARLAEILREDLV